MKTKINGININYEISGQENGPVVVLSHSLGCNLHMWEPQVAELEKNFKVLRYDMRGHGRSDAPKGKYTFEMLGEDVVGLLDELKIKQVHWVGLSIGGMIGQCLALNYPQRLSSLVLCDTGAFMPEEAQPIWQERIEEARNGGMEARVKSTLADWFTPEYIKGNNSGLEKIKQQLLTTPVDGYIGCIWALRGLNFIDRLAEIKMPSLIIVGEKDFGTPVEASKAMQERIQGSKLTIIPDAAHLSSVAKPEEFNIALSDFLMEYS